MKRLVVSLTMATGLLLIAIATAQAEPPTSGAPHIREDGQNSGRTHLQLDSHFLYGIGGQSFLGTQLHLKASVEHWTTRHALGTWDFGLQLAYHNQPTFLAPWVDTSTTKGSGQRLQLVATLGHTFHMGKRRRWSLGIRVYGGLNHWWSQYEVKFVDQGVQGKDLVKRDKFVVGGQLEVAYRFHRNVGVGIVMGGPFPTDSSYINSMFHVGAGLTFYLR